MPFVLIVVGVVLLIAAVRGDACGQLQCHEYLFYLLANDFTGPNNFIFWFLSILIIGAVGYIPRMKPISDGFLILVILVLFLTKGNPKNPGGGFFKQFEAAIKGTQSDRPVITGNRTGSAYVGGSTGGINIGGSIGLPGGGSIGIGTGGVGINLPPISIGGIGINFPRIGGFGGGLPWDEIGTDPWGIPYVM